MAATVITLIPVTVGSSAPSMRNWLGQVRETLTGPHTLLFGLPPPLRRSSSFLLGQRLQLHTMMTTTMTMIKVWTDQRDLLLSSTVHRRAAADGATASAAVGCGAREYR